MAQRRTYPVPLDKRRVIADLRSRLVTSVGEDDATFVVWEAGRRAGPDGSVVEWLRAATDVVQEQLDAAVMIDMAVRIASTRST